MVDIDEPGMAALKRELGGGENIRIIRADLSAPAPIRVLCAQLADEPIDVLINNAGLVYSGAFATMDLENFDRIIDLNLRAPVHLTSGLLPRLVESRGVVAFVASGTGLMAPGITNAYATSKYGLVGFSESLRAELRGRVGVTTICPAFVKTNIMESSRSGLKAGNGAHMNMLGDIVKRFGNRPEKVAAIIIRAIRKEKGLVPVGLMTHLSWWAKRIWPGFADYSNALLYKNMTRRGYIR